MAVRATYLIINGSPVNVADDWEKEISLVEMMRQPICAKVQPRLKRGKGKDIPAVFQR